MGENPTFCWMVDFHQWNLFVQKIGLDRLGAGQKIGAGRKKERGREKNSKRGLILSCKDAIMCVCMES